MSKLANITDTGGGGGGSTASDSVLGGGGGGRGGYRGRDVYSTFVLMVAPIA